MKSPTRRYDKYDRVPHEESLTNFPTELLDIVFSHLPLPSKVCLALGCKGLYQLYSSVLKTKELNFPRASRNGRRYIITEEYHHRMTLLLQLENHHWALHVVGVARSYIHAKSSLHSNSRIPHIKGNACLGRAYWICALVLP